MPVRRRFLPTSILALVALLFGLIQEVEGSRVSATVGQDGPDIPEGVETYPTREEPENARELVGLRDATSKTHELLTGQLEPNRS